jgi:hypothetical protein
MAINSVTPGITPILYLRPVCPIPGKTYPQPGSQPLHSWAHAEFDHDISPWGTITKQRLSQPLSLPQRAGIPLFFGCFTLIPSLAIIWFKINSCRKFKEGWGSENSNTPIRVCAVRVSIPGGSLGGLRWLDRRWYQFQ